MKNKRYIKKLGKRILTLTLTFAIFISGLQINNKVYANEYELADGVNEQQSGSSEIQQDACNTVTVTAEAPIGGLNYYRPIISIIDDLRNANPTDNLSTEEENNSSISIVPVNNITAFTVSDNFTYTTENECCEAIRSVCEWSILVCMFLGLIYGFNRLFSE